MVITQEPTTRKATHIKHADGVEAHSFRFDGPLSAHALQPFVDNGLPEGVFRAKAVIHLDSLSARSVFELCGGRVAFESYDANIADTRLGFIGRNIDGSQLRKRIEVCRLPQQHKNERRAWIG